MQEDTHLPNFKVVICATGVSITPDIAYLKERLSGLSGRFTPGDEPCSFTVNTDGVITDLPDADSDLLRVVLSAVRNFMSLLGASSDNLLVQATMAFAWVVSRDRRSLRVDWTKANFDYRFPFPNEMVFSFHFGQASIVLPGAPEETQHGDDINAYLQAIFVQEVQRNLRSRPRESSLLDSFLQAAPTSASL